jgi:hypothetical protein
VGQGQEKTQALWQNGLDPQAHSRTNYPYHQNPQERYEQNGWTFEQHLTWKALGYRDSYGQLSSLCSAFHRLLLAVFRRAVS